MEEEQYDADASETFVCTLCNSNDNDSCTGMMYDIPVIEMHTSLAGDDEEQREKVMSGDEEKLTRNDQLHMANGGGVGVSEAQLRLSPTYQKSDLWKYETPRESPKIAEKTVAGIIITAFTSYLLAKGTFKI